MEGKWNGFTEDDIKKIQEGEPTRGSRLRKDKSPAAEDTVRIPKRQARQLQSTGRKNVVRERMLQAPRRTAAVTNNVEDIPEQAHLARPEKMADEVENNGVCSEKSSESNSVGSSPSSPSTAQDSPAHPVSVQVGVDGSCEVVLAETNGGKGLSCSLDEFQERQKMMEEQNRQRKQLVSQVLADRKKRTKEEARRLQQIQDELQKLDQLLSNDVSILRNEIESASIEFMEAQKRYNKAEKEFLDAKLVLFGKLERKELLTEHLCKIIEQNELRKSRKLSELMDKLDLGISVQQPQPQSEKQNAAPVMLAPLCSLDEVSHGSSNTLKPLLEEGKEKMQTAEGNTEQEKLILQ